MLFLLPCKPFVTLCAREQHPSCGLLTPGTPAPREEPGAEWVLRVHTCLWKERRSEGGSDRGTKAHLLSLKIHT